MFNLRHIRSITSLCMLLKSFPNFGHSFHAELPSLAHLSYSLVIPLLTAYLFLMLDLKPNNILSVLCPTNLE